MWTLVEILKMLIAPTGQPPGYLRADDRLPLIIVDSLPWPRPGGLFDLIELQQIIEHPQDAAASRGFFICGGMAQR